MAFVESKEHQEFICVCDLLPVHLSNNVIPWSFDSCNANYRFWLPQLPNIWILGRGLELPIEIIPVSCTMCARNRHTRDIVQYFDVGKDSKNTCVFDIDSLLFLEPSYDIKQADWYRDVICIEYSSHARLRELLNFSLMRREADSMRRSLRNVGIWINTSDWILLKSFQHSFIQYEMKKLLLRPRQKQLENENFVFLLALAQLNIWHWQNQTIWTNFTR